ncbi:MAG: carboxypeptidase regulatory-like domain-containing protein [Nitrospiraceae bacterium]|nr:MAG: carboxypeptidase regulatory-like domain-containing protein [Nitrospiraceae bacterium]
MKKIFLSVLIHVMGIVLLVSSPFADEAAHKGNTGSVSGQLLIKGNGPLSGGTVFFFNEISGPPPTATKYWRVPTHAFKLDEEGRFKAVLPEGKYYMGASKKLSGETLGPPLDGDFFFISEDDKGNPDLHTIMQFKPLDLGVISKATPFRRESLVTKGVTLFEGIIRNEKGNPVEGMLVFAFSTPTMVGRPLFVSERSDKDGKYLLRLSGGGSYYLRARADYGGGPPAADQAMGVYNNGKPVSIKTGEAMKGIDIKVSKIGVAEGAR